jgi:hypothetical protein
MEIERDGLLQPTRLPADRCVFGVVLLSQSAMSTRTAAIVAAASPLGFGFSFMTTPNARLNTAVFGGSAAE